jgi:hypothetical protein
VAAREDSSYNPASRIRFPWSGLLVNEAESTKNDWEDRAVVPKAISDLGTPATTRLPPEERTRSGAKGCRSARTDALIGLCLD